MEKQIRTLKASEIECRIASICETGLSLLLYKDARVDQKILDETFGVFGWKRSHQSIDGSLYCTVEILDKDTGEWVAKQDVGSTGLAEKEKSQASDSFKRACFNWGIGRELYSAPFIWIPASETQIERKDGKWICKERFSVREIGYGEDREIQTLSIAGSKGRIVFEMGIKKQDSKSHQITEKQLGALQSELERTGVSMEEVRERYHLKPAESMSSELYKRVMNALAKTKTTQAA